MTLRRLFPVVVALVVALGNGPTGRVQAAPAANAARPADGKTAVAKPGEAKPGDMKPAETKPSPTKGPEAKRLPLPPPIVFFIANGDADACGPGCRQWIAAEGTIDTGADARLRSFLRKLGGRKLPIFFHSPGGSVPNGLAIGRIMREHGLTAGVARTVPAGCDPKQLREPACDRLERSGRELVAELDTTHTMCNSSCVYAIVGAAVREIPAGVTLGIHSSSISFSLKRTDPLGHVTRVPTQVSSQTMRNAIETGYERISAYLREMGVPQTLLTAAREVSNDHLRFLTRDEIAAFGIDRRDTVEGAWSFIDQSPGASAVKLIETKDAGAATYRRTILRLSCRDASTMRLQYAREVATSRAVAVPLQVTAGTSSFPLGRAITVAQSNNRPPLEVHNAELPLSVLEAAGLAIERAATTAEVHDPAHESVAADVSFATVTARTSGAAFATLLQRCNTGASVNLPGLNVPGLNIPGLKEPGLKDPGLKEPGPNGPSVNGPSLDAPRPVAPATGTPATSTPGGGRDPHGSAPAPDHASPVGRT
jgi:hypothetical protein